MKGYKIFFWVYAVLMSVGVVVMIDDGSFDVYSLIALIHSWVVVHFAETMNNK